MNTYEEQTQLAKIHRLIDNANLSKADRRILQLHTNADVNTNTSFVGPIIHSRTMNNYECIHEGTSSPAADPHVFIRLPYRQSVMTLLRKVCTKPCDTAGKQSIQDPPLVYATFQNHWHPSIDIPVLTIVGGCNTNISRPMYSRFQYGYAHLEFHVSTTKDQHKVAFDIPLYITQRDADKKIVLQTHFNMDLPDQLTSYVLHPEDEKEPIAKINVWNLSARGCHTLHVTNLLQPHRVKSAHEMHILGLTGCTDKIFKTIYLPLNNPLVQLLEEEDLVSIGYRNKRHGNSVPVGFMTEPVHQNDVTDRNLMSRLTPQKAAYFNIFDNKLIEIPGRRTYTSTNIPPFDPLHYPPPTYHKEVENDTIPELFPPGFHTYRQIQLKPNILTSEIISDIQSTYHISKGDTITYMSNQYKLPKFEIENHIDKPFSELVERHGQYKTLFTNPKAGQFIRPQKKDPPGSWIPMDRHPCTKGQPIEIDAQPESRIKGQTSATTIRIDTRTRESTEARLINDTDSEESLKRLRQEQYEPTLVLPDQMNIYDQRKKHKHDTGLTYVPTPRVLEQHESDESESTNGDTWTRQPTEDGL